MNSKPYTTYRNVSISKWNDGCFSAFTAGIFGRFTDLETLKARIDAMLPAPRMFEIVERCDPRFAAQNAQWGVPLEQTRILTADERLDYWMWKAEKQLDSDIDDARREFYYHRTREERAEATWYRSDLYTAIRKDA